MMNESLVTAATEKLQVMGTRTRPMATGITGEPVILNSRSSLPRSPFGYQLAIFEVALMDRGMELWFRLSL